MRSVRLSEAKDNLAGLMDKVKDQQEIFEMTGDGRSVTELMSIDALHSLHETLFWLCPPAARETS